MPKVPPIPRPPPKAPPCPRLQGDSVGTRLVQGLHLHPHLRSTTANPLLMDWASEFGLPPFEAITPPHYEPAFEVALAEHIAELQDIAQSPDTPTFDNTVVAFDRAGPARSLKGPPLRQGYHHQCVYQRAYQYVSQWVCQWVYQWVSVSVCVSVCVVCQFACRHGTWVVLI